MRSLRHFPFLLAILWGLVPAVGKATPSRIYELPDHGALVLAVPDNWSEEMNRPPNRMPPTIVLKSGGAGSGQVRITAMWPILPATSRPDESTIRSRVADAAKAAESQSVEGMLPLQELQGTAGRGFYFLATDRAAAPGEYKFLAQGIIHVGDIALAFTVLTNDGQEAVVTAALQILRTAIHRPSGVGT